MKTSIIFSVYKDLIDDGIKHHAVVNALKALGIPFQVALGCYKGKEEKSIIVDLESDEKWTRYDLVTAIAQVSNQESILMVDEDGNATLIDLNTFDSTSLGVMTEVSESEAKWKHDAYTCVEGVYYVALSDNSLQVA